MPSMPSPAWARRRVPEDYALEVKSALFATTLLLALRDGQSLYRAFGLEDFGGNLGQFCCIAGLERLVSELALFCPEIGQ
jgi:hypothetical protein